MDGFPGGLENLMAQAQQMSASIERLQGELKQRTVTAGAGGGMVEVAVSGEGLVQQIKIDPSVVDPNDVDMLQDLIRAAVNEGVRKARDMMHEEMKKLTGGLPIPNLF